LTGSPEADGQLAALRLSYEPYVAALSHRLQMPLPCLRRIARQADNWQTEPLRDGGAHL
jgi:hypothetical protein